MQQPIDPRQKEILDRKQRLMQKQTDWSKPQNAENDMRRQEMRERNKWVDQWKKHKKSDEPNWTVEPRSIRSDQTMDTTDQWIIPRQPQKPEGAFGERAESKKEAHPSAMVQLPTKGLPSLYECAERLKEKVHLVFYQKNLYAFNGRCYQGDGGPFGKGGGK